MIIAIVFLENKENFCGAKKQKKNLTSKNVNTLIQKISV
jgi:hypothetical protein